MCQTQVHMYIFQIYIYKEDTSLSARSHANLGVESVEGLKR